MPQRVDDIQWVPRQLTYQEQQAWQHVRAVPLPHAIEAWYLINVNIHILYKHE